ncbi:MAG: CAP domain-containing protein [Deltaproteobacteria bacterium]|nr:CAP domain-containing protein [Deltaproteobacteria bacterium]
MLSLSKSWPLLIGLVFSGCVQMVESPEGVTEEPVPAQEQEDEDVGATDSINLTIDAGLDVEERVFLAKLNEYRAANGLAPLQVSVALSRAADVHALDMAAQNYFSHDSKDGTTWSARVKQYYNYATYLAENIAAGNAGGDATFTQWKNSPGHDANMKGTSYRVIGIARAYNAAAQYRWYWVTDFGGYVDEVMTTEPGPGPGPTPPPPPPPTPTNLLANGGFEVNDLGQGVLYTAVRTTGRWFAGSQQGTASITGGALRIVDALVGYIGVAQLVAATPGKTYTVSAKARRVSGYNGQIIYLDFLDGAYNRIRRSQISGGSGTTFHTVTGSQVAPVGTAFVRVALYGYAGNNDWYSTYDWDDVSLTAP